MNREVGSPALQVGGPSEPGRGGEGEGALRTCCRPIRTVNTHFDPEDGGSMYLRNISSTAHFYLLQHPASGLTIEQP